MEASALSDFAPPHEVIELPVKGSQGQTLTVEVRAVDALVVMEAMQGIPGYGKDPDPQSTEEQVASARAMAHPLRVVCRAGIVAPLFSFDGSGSVQWDDVALANRYAIFAAILRLSGFGEVPGAAGTFPQGAASAGGGGRADGGAGGGDGAAVAATE